MAAEEKDDPGGIAGLDALADQIRAAAKWLIGAFAAVAALFVPGVQLAGIGSLSGSRLYWALAAFLVAVAGAIIAIAIVGRFLAPTETSLVELATREERVRKKGRGTDSSDDLIDYLHKNDALLQGQATDLGDLRRQYQDAVASLEAAKREASPVPAIGPLVAEDEEKRKREVERAFARLAGLKYAVDSIEGVARLEQLREDFLFRRWLLAAAALLIAVAIAGFAVAAHPPGKATGDFSHAKLKSLDLSGTDLRKASFEDATLTGVDLSGADMKGANFDGARFSNTTCPDGTNSDNREHTCANDIYIPRPLGPPVGLLFGGVRDGRG